MNMVQFKDMTVREFVSAVYVGENRIGQTMFDHAFYPPWQKKPGMLETFRTRAQDGHVMTSHKLDEQRLNATCSAMNHTAMHLAGGVVIPALDKIAPVFSPGPPGKLPMLNSAARLHRIATTRRAKQAKTS